MCRIACLLPGNGGVADFGGYSGGIELFLLHVRGIVKEKVLLLQHEGLSLDVTIL